uniref:4Fe-4S ferredoxin-type domain-containing protein n=1 Tax=Trichuris muris TaxID=70415 RepID=A0A5S6QZL5_TRIMR
MKRPGNRKRKIAKEDSGSGEVGKQNADGGHRTVANDPSAKPTIGNGGKAADEENVGRREDTTKCPCCCCTACGTNCTSQQWLQLSTKICNSIDMVVSALMEEKLPRRGERVDKQRPKPASGDSPSDLQDVGMVPSALGTKRTSAQGMPENRSQTDGNAMEPGQTNARPNDATIDNTSSWEALLIVLVLLMFGLFLSFISGGIPGWTFNSGSVLWRQL